MNWLEFSNAIDSSRCVTSESSQGSVKRLFHGNGIVRDENSRNHMWYPYGVENEADVNGYRYVDMNFSYCGRESMLLSEASCCMIVVAVDYESQVRFGAHISAATDTKRLRWISVKADFQLFFKQAEFDFDRIKLFIFSENALRGSTGAFEQRNVMNMLNHVLSDQQQKSLARSTHLIQGEKGINWNPYCAVRLSNDVLQKLEISLAA